MENIKNIIIVNDFDYNQGGASKVAIDTANILLDKYKNINVYFFSAVHRETADLDEKVVRICTNQNESLKEKNKFKGIANGIYNLKAKRKFKKLLTTLNSSNTIIHVHGWTKALSSSIFDIAFKMNFKIVLTMHDYFIACPNGGYFNYAKNEVCPLKPLSWKCIKCNCDSRNYLFKVYRIIRQLVQNKIVKLDKKITDVISISELSEKILSRTLTSTTKIHRVYNPIDIDRSQQKVDYKKNKYYLYVGRISKEKGVDIFCEAITKMDKIGVVVGDGDQKELLEKKYPNIKFVGWKNSSDVKNYMKKARMLIFPSKLYETMGLTPLEIMQYGIPAIVSDCTGAADYISDKKMLFNVNDISTLISAIEYVDNNDISIKNFDFGNYGLDIMKIYNKVLNKK